MKSPTGETSFTYSFINHGFILSFNETCKQYIKKQRVCIECWKFFFWIMLLNKWSLIVLWDFQQQITAQNIWWVYLTFIFFYSRYDFCLLMVFSFDCSDPLDLAPIQEIDRDLCDPEKLRTVERLVDDLTVALSQHFPRMWSC